MLSTAKINLAGSAKQWGLLVVCLLALLGLVNISQAKTSYKSGAVIARTVVLDENGQPILVEYDDSGNEIREISLPGQYQNQVDALTIMSGASYRFYQQQLTDFRQQHANDLALGAELMDRNQFLSTVFTAADNATTYNPPALPDSVKSVLVRGQSNRIRPNSNELILLSFSVNLANPGLSVVFNDKSVLLSPEGSVVATSPFNIAYRVGFFGNPDEPQTLTSSIRRNNDDTIFGPVPGVKVYVDQIVYPGGLSVTNEEGKYSFQFRLPTCPVGGFEFTTDVWAEVRYKNFLPIGSPAIPYYLRKQEWDYCYAGLIPGPLGIGAIYQEHDSATVVSYNSDLKLDVMFLTGKVSMRNLDGSPITINAETTYSAFSEAEEKVAQTYYDFNGDGTNDIVVLGKRLTVQDEEGNDVEAFVPEDQLNGEEPDLQGVYFSAANLPTGAEDLLEKQPDLIRIIDNKKRVEETVGVLETISVDDYKNTDILFFRESTGQLVMERRGLRDEQVNGRVSSAYDDGSEQIAYRVMLRGPRDSDLNIGGGNRTGGYEQWASDNLLTAPFQTREADHLKPGETVRVVAVNRATGYVGTARVLLSSASNNPGNMLSVEVPDITMQPPNLKIWAERNYEVEFGLTQGEERNYVIGSEGAGLTSDTLVTIYTEWLDQDGSPLPDELGLDNGEQYGLTGRLAKVVAPNLLQGTSVGGSDLAEFPIAPGRKIQAINVRSNLSSAEHYYIHVIGKAKDQECVVSSGANCPSFDLTGEDVGAAPPYDARPALFTPFKVPLFDEDSHWQTYNAYRKVLDDFDPDTDDEDDKPIKPLPTYAWQYRPEYQFSQFQLEVQEINRFENAETDEEEKFDILKSESPIVDTSDKFIEVFYSFLSSNFERLSPFDGNQEFVLALGEDEQRVTIGKDKTIRFENLDHLSALNPEDFLSMRLYVNNDAANILWEYAFVTIGLKVDYNRDGVISNSASQGNLPTTTQQNAEKANASEDITEEIRPFRFWINENFDAVIHEGEIEPNLVECSEEWMDPKSQSCEQDTVFEYAEDSSTLLANNDEEHLTKIESIRDLEDFAPMIITLSEDTYRGIEKGEYSLAIRAVGVGINLFVGQYEDNDVKKYLTDRETAQKQVEIDSSGEKGQHYLFNLEKTQEGDRAFRKIEVSDSNDSEFHKMFDEKTHTAKLIFEGVEPSADACTLDSAKGCFVEVIVTKGPILRVGNVLEAAKVYMDLQPIKTFYDHFTAGTWVECRDKNQEGECLSNSSQLYNPARNVHAGEAENPNDFVYEIRKLVGDTVLVIPPKETGMWYKGDWVDNYEYRPLFTPENEEERQAEDTDYILLVHGWRMPYAEREIFAEITMKRLFWSGFKGRFGTFTWPTGWFDKPAWLTGASQLPKVLSDLSNYSRSEEIARDTGPILANKLSELKNHYKSLHLIAHSMGNVVISEALAESDGIVADSYIATQAATSAGAYAPTAAPIMSTNVLGARNQAPSEPEDDANTNWWGRFTTAIGQSLSSAGATVCLGGNLTFETVWRCHNVDSEHFTLFNRWYHIPPDMYRYQQLLNGSRLPGQNYFFQPYYQGISDHITNRNIVNYFSEVDAALSGWNLQQLTKPDIGWIHNTEILNDDDCDDGALTPEEGVLCQIEDKFRSDTPPDGVDYDLSWPQNKNAILAHIIPSRTYALGATSALAGNGEIRFNENLQTRYGFTPSNYDHSAQFLSDFPARHRYWEDALKYFGFEDEFN